MSENREQSLIDVMFEIALMTQKNRVVQNMSTEELTQWIRKQIKLSTGIETVPVGSSHGVIMKK